MAPLELVAGTLMWTPPVGLNSPGQIVAVRNASGVPKSFALGKEILRLETRWLC